MKKIIFLVYFILIFSCSKQNTPLNEKALVEDSFTVKKYSTKSLVKEKFLEFYDLRLLLEENPQFKENIKSRLMSFKLDSSEVLKITPNSKIKKLIITELLLPKKNSDSLLKVLFEISENNILKKDSIIAYINDNKIMINEEVVTTRKIKFKKFNP